jgi:hypothetical protein
MSFFPQAWNSAQVMIVLCQIALAGDWLFHAAEKFLPELLLFTHH